MKYMLNKCLFGLAILLIVGLASCDKEDEPLPFTVNFESTEFGISESVSSATVTVLFSRAITSAGSVKIQIAGDLSYGEDADYYTAPAMTNGSIILPYETGDELVSFTLSAGSALNIDADKILTVTFRDVSDNLSLGTNTSVYVVFSENFIAGSGSFELNGGGDEMPNQAFVDLSKLNQPTIDKLSWDIGFYSKTGEHNVVVNNSSYVMAQAIEKTDLNTVVAADTTGFGADMVVSNYSNTNASNWIDHQEGDLDETAFGTISSTDSENKVFIIRRLDGNWKKVRVLQSGDNYTLRYADISATSYTETTVTKNSEYNFSFFDLDNGFVDVEPKKGQWDLMYGTLANRANFGSILAIGYKDFIVSNRNGVEVAQVMTSEIAYDNFQFSNISALTFKSKTNAIGSTWRSGGGPSGGPELYTDRYYILKDPDGHYYKIQFTALYKNTTDRGYPKFSFEIITQ